MKVAVIMLCTKASICMATCVYRPQTGLERDVTRNEARARVASDKNVRTVLSYEYNCIYASHKVFHSKLPLTN